MKPWSRCAPSHGEYETSYISRRTIEVIPARRSTMASEKAVNSGRRTFITRTVPACALTCLAARNLFALVQTTGGAQEAVHKFDGAVSRKSPDFSRSQSFGSPFSVL